MSEPSEVKTLVRPEVIKTDQWGGVQLQPMHPVALVAVRCTRVYLQTVLGLLSAGGLGMVPGWTPGELASNVQSAAMLSMAPVVFTFLQNTLELLARIDERRPEWRA
jgi:hypothetical protein